MYQCVCVGVSMNVYQCVCVSVSMNMYQCMSVSVNVYQCVYVAVTECNVLLDLKTMYVINVLLSLWWNCGCVL